MRKKIYLVFTVGLILVLLALLVSVRQRIRHGNSVVEDYRYNEGNFYVTLPDGEYLANSCEDGMTSMLGVIPGIEYSELFGVIISCNVYVWGIQ